MDMSRSRYFLIVAGLFLGTSLLLAPGEHVFADEWDYSEWNYFDSVDYSAPQPQTYPDWDWGNAYYPLETIQDPYNVFQTQDSQPIDNYGLWDSGTIYAPASYAESGNPDVTQSSFFAAQSESEAQTIVPPENNLFTRIFEEYGSEASAESMIGLDHVSRAIRRRFLCACNTARRARSANCPR